MECDMADVKFETVEDIDKKIAELQSRREAVLKDEKKNVADYVKTYGEVEVTGFKRITLG